MRSDAKQSVLVVEDEELMRSILRELLEEAGVTELQLGEADIPERHADASFVAQSFLEL